MSQSEKDKRVCEIHKLEIIIVDLKSSTRQEDKYLCAKCLSQKIDYQNFALLTETIEMIQDMKTQSYNLNKEQNQIRLNKMRQLQTQILEFEGYFKATYNKILINLNQQINHIEREFEISEPLALIRNLEEDIEILSKNYQGNFKYIIPTQQSSIDYDVNFVDSVNSTLSSLFKSQQYNQILEQIEKIKQTQITQEESKIDQAPLKEFDKHKTPSLKQLCNKHGKEIIMVNINQKEAQFDRFACVDCIQEFPIQYITLEEVNKRWHLLKGQSEDLINKYNSKRENHFNHSIQIINKLRDHQEEIINEIIKSLDRQIKQNNDQVISINIFNQKEVFSFEGKQIQQIVQLLCQKDQNKHITDLQEYQNQQDIIFYSNLINKLDNLMNYDIQSLLQIMKSYNLLKSENNLDINENKNQLLEFIQKCQLQVQNLKIFEESVQSQKDLDKFYDSLQRNGLIQQIINSNQDQTFFKKLHQQFEENTKRMKKLIMADENELCLSEIILQREQEETKFKEINLELAQIKDQNRKLEEDKTKLQKDCEDILKQREKKSIELQNLLDKATLDNSFLQNQQQQLNKEIKDLQIKYQNAIQLQNINVHSNQIKKPIIQEITSQMKFSHTFKHQSCDVASNGEITTCNASSGYYFCVCSKSIPKQDVQFIEYFTKFQYCIQAKLIILYKSIITQFSFKILNSGGYMVGIGNIEKMLKENYYGCHGYLKGTYMIQYDGRCWVEDQEKNGKNLSFKYSKDDIIIIQVNMSTKTLLWTKKVTNESFAINIDTSGELHPCIALAENGASIQLFS